LKYHILRRILLAVPIAVAVMTFVFFIVRVLPGDPAVTILGNDASDEALAELRNQLGLNYPLWEQYLIFVRDILRFDFGQSMISRVPVAQMIKRALPYTVDLVFASMLISVLIGIPLGIATAMRRNQAFDYFGRLIALLGLSIPDFFLGILFMLLFSVTLQWLPLMGGGDLDYWGSRLTHLILPASTLGFMVAAFITRMTRSTMLEVLRQQYIKTAHAKGQYENVVIYKHALRNALIPIITVVGIYLNVLLGGTVLIETVFNRPGLGKLIVGAIMQRDYVVLQSVLMIFSIFIVFVNLIIDLLYRIVDPRIRTR